MKNAVNKLDRTVDVIGYLVMLIAGTMGAPAITMSFVLNGHSTFETVMGFMMGLIMAGLTLPCVLDTVDDCRHRAFMAELYRTSDESDRRQKEYLH